MTDLNTSGIKPIEFKVLILPDDTEKVTSGGIHIPERSHERHEWAQVRGVLVAKGARAFEDTSDGPNVGDHVYYAKYQGIVVPGEDGKDYRLCNDKEVAAVVQ